MGQATIKDSLLYLDVRDSPLGPAQVFKMERPPHCFVQRLLVPGEDMEAEKRRLAAYQDIQHHALCTLFAVENESGVMDCAKPELVAYCLYLPLTLRQWLRLFGRRLDHKKLVHMMAQLLGLGVELAMVHRCRVVAPGQLSLDNLYVDITGEVKIHPFPSQAPVDALPEQ
jgi:hypothetical protein